MATSFRTLRRLAVAALTALAAFLPLPAQWDPRLQHSPTDFLSLYQQTTNSTIVPEILTIFDFSGSMSSLMFHPLYPNKDVSDGDDYQNMTFTMATPATGYTVKASNGSRSSTSYTFTVGGSGAGALNNGSSHYTFTLMTAAPTSFAVGNAITFSTTLTSSNARSYPTNTITWTVTDNNNNQVATGSTSSAFGTASTFQFTIPQPTAVTASLRVDPSAAAACATCTMNTTLTGGILIKPNGQPVTSSDAASATQPTGLSLHGIAGGASDIRNWIRAASHARFSYNDNGTTRTIDIPMPWRITGWDGTGNALTNSTGNPLSPLLIGDPVSGTNVEFDLCWQADNGDDMLYPTATDRSGNATAVTLGGGNGGMTLCYRPAYIAWLFQGKYLDGPNAGKYVAFDAANAGIVGGQGSAAWGQGYGSFASGATLTVPVYDSDGSYANTTATVAASTMAIPARSRCQAVKQAAITTWITYQTQVVWAYRFLDVNHESGIPSAATTFSDASGSYAGSDPTAGTLVDGGASGWQVMNGNSTTEMKRIASYFPSNGTPLTYAMARGLSQFLDTNSVFNGVENGTLDPLPTQCLNHFLILFTDGIDNNNSGTNNVNTTTPYLDGTGLTGTALAGNLAVMAHPGYLNGGQWWDLFSFAGVAAHLNDKSLGSGNYLATPGSYPSSGTPSNYLPYAITARNGVAFTTPQRIQTMTVGVSLGGQYTDSSSPKRSLFIAAATGDPHTTSWNLAQVTPFTLKNPNDPTQGGTANSIYFFDGSNPDALTSSLDSAFRAAIAISNVNATTSPNLPFVGGSLANEVYLGTFQPPQDGGVLWAGDLLMFPTRILGGTPTIVNSAGNPLTTLNASSATWAASLALNPAAGGRLWSARQLYTRLPGATSLTPFTDLTTAPAWATGSPSNPFGALSPYLLTDTASPTAAQKTLAVQWAAGGNTAGALDGSGRPTSNRNYIMGDIIDSAPAAVEYTWSPFITGNLTPRLTAAVGSGTNHFRLIVVGDNSGWLHGFGEVSNTVNAVDANGNPVKDAEGNIVTLTTGAVDELWAFMPTDFLGYLDQLERSNNAHRFMVDGSPSFYFLDIPAAGQVSGNHTVDQNTGERAVVICGLGGGGRSYYALNVINPFTPALAWSLVPDEASGIPQSRCPGLTLANVQKAVANMGFSSCMPAQGRVINSATMVPEDVIFLGGGYSNPSTEAYFPSNGAATPLGRAVLALDAATGNIVACANLAGFTAASGKAPGPVAAGLVPFEFILNSGLTQRAYFTDFAGGLWSWDQDQQKLPASVPAPAGAYTGFRADTAYLDRWTGDGSNGGSRIRQIYQDTDPVNGAIYSTLPAPFLIGTFTGAANLPGGAVPAAVGVSMVSGDRFNPTDVAAAYPNGVPSWFRLTTVFDRQDNPLWAGQDGGNAALGADGVIRDANVSDFSDGAQDGLPGNAAGAAVITPYGPSYYLAPYNPGTGTPSYGTTRFGYYLKFPRAANGYLAKGVSTPEIVSGALFESYFNPTSVDPCSGATGNTYTNLICDVINPARSATGASCQTGNALGFTSWSGMASTFMLYGNGGVIQAGTTSNSANGITTEQVTMQTMIGQTQSQYPKIRAWRTVH